ncbi:hypothetical protein [Desulfovibrio sp. JC010]|uniref:hypothetical protein n=1 Tax=Desulfovibrio sp. JC010 TaxID=2593641 RepID=UPI0013D700DF|nr:hypothetical protein [Desulfovibrio sp. JC010]NDV27100.1 hypothetical protein [Desulfovibrio sp. JC010]
MEKAKDLGQLLRVTKTSPLQGDSYDSFFVETDDARGANIAFQLCDYFSMNVDDPQKVLFMGHRGSGKSTELYRVEKELGDEFKVIKFSILDEADGNSLQHIDVLFIILSKLYESAIDDEIEVDQTVLDNLVSYWHGETLLEDISFSKNEISGGVEVKGGLLGLLTTHIGGIFKTGNESKETVRRYVEPKISRLIQDTNDLIADISSKYGNNDRTMLLIIEDLDKLDIEVAENLFLNHSKVLTSFNLHVVYTFPIFLHYSEKFRAIEESFDHAVLLSMIKVNTKEHTPYEEGRNTLKDLLERRFDLSLINDEALDLIIEKSGGAIRLILKMVQDAALTERSQDRKSTSITVESAQKAYVKMRSDFERCIERKHLVALKDLYESEDKKPLQDDSLKEMLSCLAVIEYNGDRWCGLHPAVEDYLKGKGEIK